MAKASARWPLDQLYFHDIQDVEMQITPHRIELALKPYVGEVIRITAQHSVTERGFTVTLEQQPQPKRKAG